MYCTHFDKGGGNDYLKHQKFKPDEMMKSQQTYFLTAIQSDMITIFTMLKKE